MWAPAFPFGAYEVADLLTISILRSTRRVLEIRVRIRDGIFWITPDLACLFLGRGYRFAILVIF